MKHKWTRDSPQVTRERWRSLVALKRLDARSPRNAQTTPCHRGCHQPWYQHSAKVGLRLRWLPFAEQRRPTFQLRCARSRIDWCRACLPSRDRPLHQSMRSRSSSQTRSVSTVATEQSAASVGDAQSERGSSGREATLLARVLANEQPTRSPRQGSRLRTVLSRELRRSPCYQEDPSRDSGNFPSVGKPSWDLTRNLSKIRPSVGVVPQRKVLRMPLPKSWRQWLTNRRKSSRE